MDFDAKGVPKLMPKLIKNQWPNWLWKKSLKLSKFMFPRMVKSFKFIVKTMVFEGLTGCVREQKMYQNNIQTDTNIHAKIDENSKQTLCSKK